MCQHLPLGNQVSSSNPKDNQDWENFRFPTRPVLAYEDEAGDDDERSDEEGGEGDDGHLDLRPRRGSWEYRADSRCIASVSLGKRIMLDEIDQVQKIVRLLALIEERTDYDLDTLIDALDAASMDCFGHALGQVLADHRWGIKIEWKPLISMEISIEDPEVKNSLSSKPSLG